MSQHIAPECFRRIGEWECLVLEKVENGLHYLLTATSVTIRVQSDDLEPYPEFVMAKEDFEGGQRNEVFRIEKPTDALIGHALEVTPIVGTNTRVMLPIWLAEATSDPARCPAQKVAV